MKYLVQFIRFFVGLSFVLSGFLKMIDPLGTSYKLEEYFNSSVLNVEFLIPYALLIGIILILVETALGFFLLIGFKPKYTLLGTLMLMLLFLFLTWYSAYYNKVTDCGCFGDAIKLTPWETFYKNVILVGLTIILLFNSPKIKGVFSKTISNWIAFLIVPAGLYFMYFTLLRLPIIDFRPYKIGTDINKGMKIKKGEFLPEIHDFILESEINGDLTDEILQQDNVLLVLMYDLRKTDRLSFEKVKEITEKALEKNYQVYGVSASLVDDFEPIKETYKLNFELLFNDATTLKTMIRANPGFMILKKGVVVDKKNWINADELIIQ